MSAGLVCAAALLLYYPLPDQLLPLPGTWCQAHGAALPLNPLLVGCTFLLLWERILSVAIIAAALLAGAFIK